MKQMHRQRSDHRCLPALCGLVALAICLSTGAALAQTAPAQVVGPAPGLTAGTTAAADPALQPPPPPPPSRTREILDIQMRSRFQTPPPSSRLESGEAAAIYKHHLGGIGKEPLKPKDEPKRN